MVFGCFFLSVLHARTAGWFFCFLHHQKTVFLFFEGRVGAVDTYPMTSLSLSLDLGMDGMDWDWMERGVVDGTLYLNDTAYPSTPQPESSAP